MKTINAFLISSMLVVVLAPMAFGAGNCPQKATTENGIDSTAKSFNLAENSCSFIDPRCDAR